MKLSVIIVNYNVKYFLEQCLHSVIRATEGIDSEIYVVDNNSVDSSCAMVREKFGFVHLIENKENKGFSVANNQALRLAKGEYVLLLNPDTIVEDETFRKTLFFMDSHPDAGGLGVKMVDGSGRFLPESKRGLPTPMVAFYKVFGLAKLFPRSKTFGKYHLGHLDKDKIAEVDILAGAFMMIRKSVLDAVGLLDETFFMYGEDIDLSFRIQQSGKKNYYFPETRIIHYKGESTKKSSVNYVFTFYNAMIIFARKHFSKQNATFFSFLIHTAIYLRAFLALISRFFKKIFLPFLDAGLIFTGIFFFKNYWEKYQVYSYGGHYPPEYMTIVVPAYLCIWILSVLICGGYDKPLRLSKTMQGIFAGTVFILVFYALLPEHYRYSRALLLLGGGWALLSMMLDRVILAFTKIKGFRLSTNRNLRFIIAGEKEEAERVAGLLRNTYINPGFIGFVSQETNPETIEGWIGNLSQLKDIITIYQIDEVIFCARDIPAHTIIDKISEFQTMEVECKIAPPESLSIIGSKSINTSGDLYIIDINSIGKINNRRNKRLFDLITSILLIIFSPVVAFFQKKPLGFLMNCIRVLLGNRTWVGYYTDNEISVLHLPKLRTGILSPLNAVQNISLDNETINRLNLLYARDFKINNEIKIFYKGFSMLGRV
ncbi:MAG: glycosyltransferase family 2 protein [Lentimicrobiaceae bacterium]|nr:glycosyltransferase family 2 protein [Lentimicrobiaceae bacterium]